MLQVTARIMKGTSVVGYQLTDGTQTQPVTKEQAWMYAKNKQILNVVPTGDQNNPGLSGTNGFELKKLPDISDDQANKKQNEHAEETWKDIEVINTLKDKFIQRSLVTPILGYYIRNNGKNSINIQRVTATPEHSISKIILQPNETICLNRVELARLALQLNYKDKKFANGKVVPSEKANLNGSIYDSHNAWFFSFDKEYNGHEQKSANSVEMLRDIQDFVDVQTLVTYFIPPKFNVQELTSHEKAQELSDKMKKDGIFGAFKR